MKALKKWFPLISLICGVLALVMLFLPVLKVEIMGQSETYNGLKVVFGDKDSGLAFSFMCLLTFVLAIAGGVLAFVGKENKVMQYVAIACFVLAAVFFFLTKTFMQFDLGGAEMTDEIKEEIKALKKMYDLGIGAILGGILSILGALSTACNAFVKD